MYSADEWATLTGEVISRPTLKSQVRFYLNQFDTENDRTGRVWFANTLVDGYGQFGQPLKRVRRLGEVAARLLLIMYRENRMEQFGGVPPYVAHHGYAAEKQIPVYKGYQLWHATRENLSTYPNCFLAALGLEKLNGNKGVQNTQIQSFWDALEGLKGIGLVYEVVTVLDAEPVSRDANVVYELDAISLHGYRPKGEEGLAREMAQLAKHWGCPPMWGRSRDSYALIIEQGVTPHVAGIFRLRFRVANPKNHTVSAAFQRIGTDRADGGASWRTCLSPLGTLKEKCSRRRNNESRMLTEGRPLKKSFCL